MTKIQNVILNALPVLMILFFSANAFGRGECGETIVFDCKKEGGSKGYMKFSQGSGREDAEFKIDCGANTKSKDGKLANNNPCVGSAFPCMKGKPCITMDPPPGSAGIKIHKPNCGSGGSEPTGLIKTAGCIHVSDATFKMLERCLRSKYEVKTNYAGRNGRR